MQTLSGDSDIAQFEDALNQIATATWNRMRSNQELNDFIDRRHSALANIEL